jgi:response regulator RpfG family c-di-GMP phosphodiesterase
MENIRMLGELEAARRDSLERLVLAAEYRDDGTHQHLYKEAWSIDAAMSEIPGLAGRQFDPAVVDAFTELDPTELIELPEAAPVV